VLCSVLVDDTVIEENVLSVRLCSVLVDHVVIEENVPVLCCALFLRECPSVMLCSVLIDDTENASS